MPSPDSSAPSAGHPTRRLARETSAYLRQHARNPVDWYPWGSEALTRARESQRPLLVSIGYSACHWCHVMERESFEDPRVAALMNERFVNVKVDREERPDVDRLYMDFLVRTTGHGGWPLTVFCTPEGRPFYGGTYYPPTPRHGVPSFRQILEAVAHAYDTRRSEVEAGAERVVEALAALPRGAARETPGRATLRAAAERLLAVADRRAGGFGQAPKFPTPTSLEALLAALDELPEEGRRDALEHLTLTCREMARRGLYDHLGGGFHRYCVDAAWTIPHFEKMLYDQAQLVRIYLEVWRRTDASDDDLLWTARETVSYLRRELAAPDGGFFASQDADSEGEEGRFYVWTPDQVRAVLGAERGEAFCRAYGVTEAGHFEGATSVLADHERGPRERFRDERRTLFEARARRVPPAIDEKRVTAWNAYAVSALARGASLVDDASWLADAVACADFLQEHATDREGRPLRVFDRGRAHVLGFLDDVAALLEASLDLHRAGAGERFLAWALDLADQIATRFWDPGAGELFLAANDGEPLVHRPRPEPDGATPHAAGLAALGLLRAATLAGREDWEQLVDAVLRTYAFLLERSPEAFSSLARAAAARERGLAVAVIAGSADHPDTRALAESARRALDPEDAVIAIEPDTPPPPGLDPAWVAGRDARSPKPAATLCRGTRCSVPITDPEALARVCAARDSFEPAL